MLMTYGPARALVACALTAAFTALPGIASAESYVRVGAASTDIKSKVSNAFGSTTFPKRKGQAAAVEGRFDVVGTDLYLTAGILGTQDKWKFPADFEGLGNPEFTIKQKSWGANGGFGLILSRDASSEVAVGLSFASGRSSAKLEAEGMSDSDCCSTYDVLTPYLSGYSWVVPSAKLYGQIGYDKGSHDVKGYNASVGLEFAVSSASRLFVEYQYQHAEVEDSGATFKQDSNVFAAGVKFPFGAKAVKTSSKKKRRREIEEESLDNMPPPAPVEETPVAAPAPAPAPAPVAAPAPAPAPVVVAPPAPPAPKAPAEGATAKLKPGAPLKGQPKTEGTTVDFNASQVVTLKAGMTNAEGKWWYVTSPGGNGWVQEANLEMQP